MKPQSHHALTDPLEVRFRLDSVAAGAWVSFLMCASVAAYVAGYADENRAVMGVLVAVAFAASVGVFLLPWEQIIRSPWREAAFLGWTLGDFVLIGAIAALDGGGDSPLALTFFIPIVFVGLSYPVRSVIFVGVLGVVGYIVLAVASGDDAGHTMVFASTLLGVALMSAWQARNHERRREHATRLSRTDPLTDALNRRGFEEAARAVLSDVDRGGSPACLLLLDLDRFKAYNDTHGHTAGDQLLCDLVDGIRPILRPTDALARIGGDEFAVLLPHATREQAVAVADRVRDTLGIPHSVGLACAPDDGLELDALYHHADQALYEAKRRMATEPSAPPRARGTSGSPVSS